jgi:hypothetical protein
MKKTILLIFLLVLMSLGVTAAAPIAGNVSITPTTAFPDSALTGHYNFTDPDGGNDSSTTRWYVNNIQVGVNSTTLASIAFDEADVVIFGVEPYDGNETGTNVNSSSLTISAMTTDRINFNGLIATGVVLLIIITLVFSTMMGKSSLTPQAKKIAVTVATLLLIAGALFLFTSIV